MQNYKVDITTSKAFLVGIVSHKYNKKGAVANE